MGLSIKKVFIDPLIDKKIKNPSPKNIAFLKLAGKYDAFLELMYKQHENLKNNALPIVTLITGSTVCLGAAIVKYAKVRDTNELYFDEADRMVNESIADCDKTLKKESK